MTLKRSWLCGSLLVKTCRHDHRGFYRLYFRVESYGRSLNLRFFQADFLFIRESGSLELEEIETKRRISLEMVHICILEKA